VDNPTALFTSVNAYQLQFGSALAGRGIDLEGIFGIEPGLQDFFGINLQPSGSFPVGADAHLGSGSGLTSQAIMTVASDDNGRPQVNVYDAATAQLKYAFFAYSPYFLGGVRVAVGDFTGAGFPEIVTAPGPGGGPDIRIFDGRTGAQIGEFLAYDYHFDTGVFVAAGDVNGSGHDQVVTAPDQGGGPDIRIFDGLSGTKIGEFLAYNYYFEGGVRITVGAVTGNSSSADIITAPGPGGGPDIRVFQGLAGTMIQEFLAYDYNFDMGVFVAAGDVNGDGKADIITAPGQGGGPDVRVFNGAAPGQLIQEFLSYAYQFDGGVRVAAFDLNGDGKADIVTVPGGSGGPEVAEFQGLTSAPLNAYFAFNPTITDGLFVGAQ
jgi:hypothetical protein